MKPASVLVTGSSGFIGFPVAQRFAAEGCTVVGLDPVPPRQQADFDAVTGDLSDVHQIYRLLNQRRIDTVVHSGAISGGMLARDDPYRVCRLNIIGTVDLIEAARASGVKRFVYVSSCSAYGPTPPGPVGEDAPLRPGSVYSATKGAGDLLVMAYRKQYGFDAVSLRVGGIYGPGRTTWCVIKTMVEDAVAGRPTHFDWGADQSRIHLYIDDTVEVIVRAAHAKSTPLPVYNVTNPDLVSNPRIAAIVGSLVPGAKITFEPGGNLLVYERTPFDVSAVERDLGFVPSVPIKDGISRYVEWQRLCAPDGPRH